MFRSKVVMPERSASVYLQACLERMNRGDDAAREELLQHAGDRLVQLTRRMLRGFPGVQRWEQTDDVLQGAVVRLLRTLRDVPIASVQDFFALATVQVRRQLLDLARHYYGARGLGANHASQARAGVDPVGAQPAEELGPGDIVQWTEFHEKIDELPEDERDVVGLLFYQGLTQPEAAELLGVSVRTVQRRWQAALLQLHEYVRDERHG